MLQDRRPSSAADAMLCSWAVAGVMWWLDADACARRRELLGPALQQHASSPRARSMDVGARRSMPKQAGTSASPAAAMARAPGARLDVCGQRSRAARKHERRAAVLRSPGPCGRAASAGGLARARSGGGARRAAGARVAHPPQLLPGRQARPQARRAVAALLRAAGRLRRRAQRLRMCPP